MRYAFVAEHRGQFSVRAMCRCLRIQPSGFYAWLKAPLSKRAREDARQTELLDKAWKESGRVYGYRKLHDDLLDQGESSCANRIARLAKLAGIKAQIGYKRRPGSYGGKPSVVVDNTLARQFDVDVASARDLVGADRQLVAVRGECAIGDIGPETVECGAVREAQQQVLQRIGLPQADEAGKALRCSRCRAQFLDPARKGFRLAGQNGAADHERGGAGIVHAASTSVARACCAAADDGCIDVAGAAVSTAIQRSR